MTNWNSMPSQRAISEATQINRRLAERNGFTIVELAVVVIIVLIVAASAVPTLLTSLRMAHLRGAASDYSGLLEQARIYSIRDNRFYSTYILAASGSSLAGCGKIVCSE
jgi:prepilin-type N-terminal cleavage/methylation domain-containing protein